MSVESAYNFDLSSLASVYSEPSLADEEVAALFMESAASEETRNDRSNSGVSK